MRSNRNINKTNDSRSETGPIRPTPDDTARLEMALSLFRRGLKLLPLAPRGKNPYSRLLPMNADGARNWKSLVENPADEERVKEWFKEDPRCNFGIIAGSCSEGLAFLDVDDRAVLSKLQLPITVMVETGRGFHVYFRADQSVSNMKGPWGELRAHELYVAAPGSVHPTGKVYKWVDGRSPADVEVAEWPEDLTDELKQLTKEMSHSKPTSRDTSKEQESKARNSIPRFTPFPFIELAKDEAAAFKILRAAGCKIVNQFENPVNELGKPFLCPLPGHQEHNPSAALWQTSGELIMLHDFHHRPESGWWTLPDVCAAVWSGSIERLSKGERAAWWIRSAADAGFVQLPEVNARVLPTGIYESTLRLYLGFCDLVAVHELYKPGQEGAPFSYRFARKWCDIGSDPTVQKGLAWLLGHGYIRMVRKGAPLGEGGGPRAAIFALVPPAMEPLDEETQAS